MVCKRHRKQGGWKAPSDSVHWLLSEIYTRYGVSKGISYIHWTSERVCRDGSGGPFVATVQLPFGTFEGDACATKKAAERSAALVALWHC